MSHRWRYCQKTLTRAGSKRHHEKYTCWKRLENGHLPSSPAVTGEEVPEITFPTEKNYENANGIE